METKTQVHADNSFEEGGDRGQHYRVSCGIITCNICGTIIRNEFEVRAHSKMHSNRIY